MNESPNRGTVEDLLRPITNSIAFELSRLPGGGNNRVYAVDTESGKFLLKEYYYDPKDPRGRNGGMYVAFSPDGIHWTQRPDPVLHGTYGRIGDPPFRDDPVPLGVPNSVSDVIDATYDPVRKKYVVFAKGWIDVPASTLYRAAEIDRGALELSLRVGPPSALALAAADTLPVRLPAASSVRHVWIDTIRTGDYRVRVEARDASVASAVSRAHIEVSTPAFAATSLATSPYVMAACTDGEGGRDFEKLAAHRSRSASAGRSALIRGGSSIGSGPNSAVLVQTSSGPASARPDPGRPAHQRPRHRTFLCAAFL